MSKNDFFNFDTPFARNTIARAEGVNDQFQAIADAFDLLPSKEQLSSGTASYAADTGSANAYVVTLSPAPASIITGMRVTFKAANANTGASTINVNALGVRAIQTWEGSALSANTILAGQVVTVVYDGAAFRIMSMHGGTSLSTIAGLAPQITTVSGISSNVTTVAGISSNVTTVSGISGDVTTVAGIASDVTAAAGLNATDLAAVAAVDTDVGTLGPIAADITTVSGISGNVTSVAGNASNINTVAGISADVTAVAAIDSDVTTVAADGADIGTVAGISADVTAVAGVAANVATVAGISADVTTVAADGTDIGTVAGISADVTAVAGISANVTTVAGIDTDVTSVAGISADVTSVASISADVTSVAGIASDVALVVADSADIGTVAGISADVTAVSSISANVTTVAGISSDITAVVGNKTNIDIVAGDTADIQALGPISANIATVAGISSDVTAVAADSADIGAVAGSIANVNTVAARDADIATVALADSDISTVAGISADVTSLAGVSADIATVAGISSDVTTVAADGADIGTVAGISADITTVAGISGNVTTVAGNDANVTTVAGISANVTAVAGISSDVTAVAGISSADLAAVAAVDTEVGTVAGISANVTTVAGISGNVTTVAGVSSDVTTVAGISADVATVATNLSDVTNFADVYLGAAASDPATRADSSALQAGDLYFNTVSDALFVYDGAAWQAAALDASSFIDSTEVGTGANQIVRLDGSARLPAVDGSQLTNIPLPAEVVTPVNVSPASGVTDASTAPTLEGSTYLSLYGKTQKSSQWQISTVSDFSSITYDSNEVVGVGVTHTVPSGNLSVLQLYYFRTRYRDSDDTWSAWSTATAFTTAQAIQTPTNVTPANAATGIGETPTLEGSAYSSNLGKTQKSSQWQVSTVADFASTAYDSGEVVAVGVTHAVPAGNLSASQLYYWRTRYRDSDDAWSEWSTATTFTTAQAVETPTNVAPADAATDVGETPTLEGSAYSSFGGTAQKSSEWQISTVSDFASTVYASGEVVAVGVTHAVPAGNLSASQLYYFRTRYRDTNDVWSGWSTATTFTTSEAVETPTNVAPANAATDIGETPTLEGSAYSSFDSTAQKSSQWQISTVSDFSSTTYDSNEVVAVGVTHAVPAGNLSTSQLYYFRTRYRDTNDVWSNWSTATTFTTAASFNNFVATPSAVPSIGASHEGGFYFGQIWDEITTSATSTAIGTGSKTFTVTDAAPLFYSGQAVKVVSRGDAGGRVMEGTVTGSSGTTLTVNITSVTGSGTYTDWSVLVKYRLIIAPKSSGENVGVAYKNANTAAPTATQTLTNGPAATAAMVAADTSTVYPLAHWADGLSIGGFSDWYAPARDELELIWRNLKPVTNNNDTSNRPQSSIAYTSGGNADDLAADTHGVNRHSDPAGVAYTSTVPAQTSVAAFQSGGSEALEFGSAYYWSSSEYSSSTAWYQYYGTSVPGYQDFNNKASTYRARAVRRSIV